MKSEFCGAAFVIAMITLAAIVLYIDSIKREKG